MKNWLAVGLSALGLVLCGCTVNVPGERHARVYSAEYPPYTESARQQLEVDFFYTALTPYGYWVDVPGYARCWVPRGVKAGWRPYTDGHWVDTDDGLCWVSDYEWGWACFHYGRWVRTTSLGWCWVPGTVWGPNWCAWRWGDDWCAWAPLPPAAGFSLQVGLTIGQARLNTLIEPSWWICSRRSFILAPRIYPHIVPFTQNVTILHATRNVTKIIVRDHHAAFVGISSPELRRAVGHPVSRFRIAEAPSFSAAYRGHGSSGELHVYRPERHREVTAPPSRPRPLPGVMPPAQQRRRAQDHGRAYEQFLQSQRQQMELRQRQETARRPQTMGREELSRRHAEERRTFESHAGREEAALRQRRSPRESHTGGGGEERAREGRRREEGGQGRRRERG